MFNNKHAWAITLVLVVLTLALLLTGCGQPSKQLPNDQMYGTIVNTWTDPTTGCKYLEYAKGPSGSLTLRYLSDGKPDCPSAHVVTGLIQRQPTMETDT